MLYAQQAEKKITATWSFRPSTLISTWLWVIWSFLMTLSRTGWWLKFIITTRGIFAAWKPINPGLQRNIYGEQIMPNMELYHHGVRKAMCLLSLRSGLPSPIPLLTQWREPGINHEPPYILLYCSDKVLLNVTLSFKRLLIFVFERVAVANHRHFAFKDIK